MEQEFGFVEAQKESKLAQELGSHKCIELDKESEQEFGFVEEQKGS